MLLLGFHGMLSGTLPARAFEPSMDYWFTEILTVSDAELPAGVTVRVSDPTTQPRGSLILQNQTETLLFVLSLNYKNVLIMQTPDPNWKARVNVAHEVASYLVAPTKPATLNMEALSDLDPSLVDQNVSSIEPPPTDMTIPSPQASELLLVYGEQVLQVPFTISYALNTNYDNGIEANTQRMANAQSTADAVSTATQQASDDAARERSNNLLLVGLAGFAALLIAGWLVWRKLSRHR